MSTMPMPWMTDNCPVIEQTADGVRVGRCMFYLHRDAIDAPYRCPRHGDVTNARTKYVSTGRLTLESNLQS